MNQAKRNGPPKAMISPTYGKLRLQLPKDANAPNGGTQGIINSSKGSKKSVYGTKGPLRPEYLAASRIEAVPSRKGGNAETRTTECE